MPFGVPDTRQFPWDQALSNHLQQLINKTTGGVNTWATNPTVGVDGTTLGTNHAGYTGVNTATSSIVRWDGTAWTNLLNGAKVILGAQLSVYVNASTGNDSNDGFTSSTAWQTTSKMYQELAKYNFLEKQVNVHLGPGSYQVAFPPSAANAIIYLQGQSSASTTINLLTVTTNQTVFLEGVTLAYPSLPNGVNWIVAQVTAGSTLQIRNDVVLGSIGTFASGAGRWHFYASVNSKINTVANCPITVTGDVNALALLDASVFAFFNYVAAGAPTTYPSLAPGVNKGVVYSWPNSQFSASDTTLLINFVGTRVIDQVFDMRNGGNLNGNGNWKASVTGTVTGKAYRMTTDSVIFGSTAVTTVPGQGIAYPASISAGSKDTTSTITGSAGI